MKTKSGDIQLEYVNPDQAVKLKKLGFDLFCEATWIDYKQTTEWDEKGWKFEERGILHGRNSHHGEGHEYNELFSAPTVALALLWLSEEHKIYVSTKRASGLNWLEVCDDNFNAAISKLGLHYFSKEEAESAGLDLALDYLFKQECLLKQFNG